MITFAIDEIMKVIIRYTYECDDDTTSQQKYKYIVTDNEKILFKKM